MSEAIEELASAVRESNESLEQARDLAGTLAEQTAELAEEAASHGWRGIAEVMGAAAEALQSVLEHAQSAEECCGRAVGALNLITELASIEEVIEHLTVAGGQFGEAHSQIEAAISQADEATGHADEVGQQGLQSALPELNDHLATVLERLHAHRSGADAELEQAQAIASATAETAGAGSDTETPPKSGGAQPAEPASAAGRWVAPPTRAFGEPFNQQYEEWVRTSTGGPRDQEYLVQHSDEAAWFDAVVVGVRDGLPIEILIDAKGRYQQFINSRTGTWHKWWTRSQTGGLEGMARAARRQVAVANGRPVEWYCAEEDVADAFNDTFRSDAKLRGRIRAVHQPMPEPITSQEGEPHAGPVET